MTFLSSLNGEAETSGVVTDAFKGLSDTPIAEISRLGPMPDSFYHYTSSQGLLGILSEHTLRFSDASFMNDGSESFWGAGMVNSVIDEMLENKPPEEKNAGNSLKLQVKRALEEFQPVIFCMSQRNDMLTQWRDYGNDVVPYCIELDGRSILMADSSFPAYILRVVYDPDLQLKLIRQLLELIYAKAMELRGGRLVFEDEEAEPLLRGAAREIVSLITRFKHPSFEAEQEWRALAFKPSLWGATPKFRVSSLGVVPYYEWNSSGDRKHLPIKSVTVGPSPYAHVSILALNQFLRKQGYDVPTWYSTIPLRR